MKDYKLLQEKAKKLRKQVVELSIAQGEGHLGGSFSIIETMFHYIIKY